MTLGKSVTVFDISAQKSRTIKSLQNVIHQQFVKQTLITITFFGLLLLSGDVFSMSAQSKPPTPSAEDLQKLKKAEQVVIRALRRFGQTLDFEPVYHEMFVRDKTLWRNYFDSYFDRKSDVEEFENASQKSLKTLLAKLNNIFWLTTFSAMDEQRLKKLAKNKVIPKLNKRQQILLKNFLDYEERESVNTKPDIRDVLYIGDVTLAIIRKNFAQTIRRNAKNKVTINSVQITNHSSKESARKSKGFCEITININDEEMNILFTVAEENRQMKIVSIEGIND